MSRNGPTLNLSGSYTLDPIGAVVEYWDEFLGMGVGVSMAPYAQFFQQLLDPGSVLRLNRNGANAAFLRWSDLLGRRCGSAGDGIRRAEIQALIDEVSSALTSFEHAVPCLLVLGPSCSGAALLEQASAELRARLAGVPNLFVESGSDLMARYRVGQVHDPASERIGHVPYTPEAIAALGTWVARWYAALGRAPVKVFAVDADHTLWSGVVAEAGFDGVRIEPAHAALQHALVRQSESGRLLCLLSKNEEQDVREVFERHPDMVLRWDRLAGHRVDWNAKPDNLREITAGLGLGMDSVVFLDDSPVECAQMRARCPAVTTVRVPTDPTQLDGFVEHLWLLDLPRVTAEDRNRAGMYRDDASRAELRRGTASLQDFLDGLELVVELASPSAAEMPRLAQLTQRTNQFNASLIRCSEAEVGPTTVAGGVFHRFIRARDRFGDYGIVGQVRARRAGNALEVDLFMLSCRALGRGIEHRMLAATGAHATAIGLEEVAVLYRHGERNAPARQFLEQAFHARLQPGETWFRMPASRAAGIAFDASWSDSAGAANESATELSEVPASTMTTPDHPDKGALYERIAHTLTTGTLIVQAMAGRVRPRPDTTTSFVAPAPGHEREIASIWQQVLGVEPVGIHDRFQDLGGKSIHLVQVHARLLERLGVELDITELFQHPTVASLAAFIGERSGGRNAADSARQRGERMREARMRAARRFGAPA